MFWVSSRSGILAMLLIAVLVVMPYLTRLANRRLARPLINYRGVMGVHQVVGLVTVLLVIVHMYTSMGARLTSRVNADGLSYATLGLYAILAQSFVGLMLVKADCEVRPLWRGTHISIMVGILGLIIAHVYLNGMIIYSLF